MVVQTKEDAGISQTGSAKGKQRQGGNRCSFPGIEPGIRRRRRVMFKFSKFCLKTLNSSLTTFYIGHCSQ
jgi:hypothetical protein